MKKKFFGTIALTAGVVLLAGSAFATPLTSLSGSVSWFGTWQALDSSNAVVSDFTDATQIDFLDSILTPGPGNMLIAVATGDFAGLTGVEGSVADFSFNPFTTVEPLWSATDGTTAFSFDLTGVTVDPLTSATSLVLHGTGIFKAAGYEDTTGNWTFTGNSFTYSATSEVPEPATMLLFGAGLAGLAGIQRKRKS